MEHHAPDSFLRYGADGAPSPLSSSVTTVVRRVLDAYESGRLVEERLAEGARALSADARRRGLGVEQMIIELKRTLNMLAASRVAVDVAREIRERLVGLSIGCYYAHAARVRRPDDC